MINPSKRQFRWGPIPGRLLGVSHWPSIHFWYSGRLHKYLWPEAYVIFYKDSMLYVSEMEKLENVGGNVFREIILTKKVENIRKNWKKYYLNLIDFCKGIDKNYLKSLSNSDLSKKWKEFNNIIYLFWEPGIIPELAAYGGELILKKVIEKEIINDYRQREAISVLSAPVKFSFYQEEEVDLLRLIKKFYSKNFKNLLSQHQKKYFWVENSYFRTKVLKENFFLKRIKGKIIDKINSDRIIKKMNRRLKIAKQSKAKILFKFKNKKEIKKISDALSYCIWWQDQRKKHIFRYLHYIDLFIKEFAKRANVSPGIFDFAWPSEVSVNPSKKLLKILKERKQNYFIVYFLKNKKKCYYKEKAKRIFQTFWHDKETLVKNQLNGLVVYAGKKSVIGKVFIIHKDSDIKIFPNDRILVTTMTAPEYIVAIRKAKAIVTDTGGITCHAAIVSRELKVPCLVGTKMATKFFENNDIIEINTQTGIIKKL